MNDPEMKRTSTAHRAFSRTFLALLVMVLALAEVSVAARAESRYAEERITTAQWQRYLADILDLRNRRQYELNNQLIIEVAAERAVYAFTLQAHPAFPAVIRREIGTRNGRPAVLRTGHYAGDEAAYRKWWARFDTLDAEIERQLRAE
jgi:hypothetical protein